MKRILLFLFLLFSLNSFSQNFSRIFQNINDSIIFEKGKVSDCLNNILKVNSDITFEIAEEILTKDKDIQHFKVIQKYKSYKVDDADLRIHTKNNHIYIINGSYFQNIQIDIPIYWIDELTIRYIVENFITMRFGKGDHKLLYQIDTIFTKDYVGLDEKMHLSYKVTVVDENDISVDLNLFLDVETGQILKVEKNIFESVVGSAETRYSGRVSINTLQIDSLYVLKDTTRGNGIYIKNLHNGDDITYCTEFYDNDNNWTAQEYHNTNKDDGALDAFWALQQTYDYFYNNFNRNSFNDNGRAIYGYVHYGTNIENAYWDNTLQCLLLGDGRSRFDILTSLDVIAHEFGHAICLYTANLRYYGESGALNEGLSDIWAACVENDVTANKQKWIIGEDIEKRTGHLGLRSMSNPKTEEQPDTYGGTYWVDNLSSDCAYDNCGVHTNSGVLNHWFYLLCQGGSGINDLGNPYNVIGIDFGQAAAIVYRAECLYLTSNSNYSDMRTCTIQAALDLFPESFIFVSVISAWYAVGVEDCTLYSYTNQTLSDVKHINACSVEVSEVTIKNGGLLYIDSQNGTTLYDINVEVGGELEIH